MEKIYFDITNDGYHLTFKNNTFKISQKTEAISILNNINKFIGINNHDKGTNIFKFISIDKGFECFGFVLRKRYICNS